MFSCLCPSGASLYRQCSFRFLLSNSLYVSVFSRVLFLIPSVCLSSAALKPWTRATSGPDNPVVIRWLLSNTPTKSRKYVNWLFYCLRRDELNTIRKGTMCRRSQHARLYFTPHRNRGEPVFTEQGNVTVCIKLVVVVMYYKLLRI